MKRRVAAVLALAVLIPTVAADTVSADRPVTESGRRCFTVGGSPGDAAIVNLTPVSPSAPGNGQLVSSNVVDPPVASNVNYRPGIVDPNVAVTRIGADGRVCFLNSALSPVHLVADHLGSVDASAYRAAQASGAPLRKVDTRVGLGGSRVSRSGRLCFTVAGSPGDAAIVNLTPVSPSAPGNGQLVSSDVDDPPVASNVNYRPGLVDPNVAVAEIGADRKVCFVNGASSSVDLVADHLGTIKAFAYEPAQASGAPLRTVDTRIRLGGSRVGRSGRLCFEVAGSPGDAAIVNLTPVSPSGPGNGQLVSSNVTSPPVASNVNYRTDGVDPNIAVAKIGSDGKVCFVNGALSSVHLVADHLGTIDGSSYRSAQTNGAPLRKVDTREPLPVYSNGPDDLPGKRIPIPSTIRSILDRDLRPTEVYEVQLYAGQTVEFDVETDGYVDVRLYKPGTDIGWDSGLLAFGYSVGSQLSHQYTPAVSGVYYLRVDANSSSDSDPFEVTIREAGAIPVDGAPSDWPGVGVSVPTTLRSVLDSDLLPTAVYSLVLTAGQTVQFDVETDGYVDVRLYKPGTDIGWDSGLLAFGYSVGSQLSHQYTPAVSGVYYLRVDANSSSDSDPFEVAIRNV